MTEKEPKSAIIIKETVTENKESKDETPEPIPENEIQKDSSETETPPVKEKHHKDKSKCTICIRKRAQRKAVKEKRDKEKSLAEAAKNLEQQNQFLISNILPNPENTKSNIFSQETGLPQVGRNNSVALNSQLNINQNTQSSNHFHSRNHSHNPYLS